MENTVVHVNAICESVSIGDNSSIEAFARVYPTAIIGGGSAIGDHVVIGEGVRIGDQVSIGAGSKILGEVYVEDDVVVGPNVTVVPGSHWGGPRSKKNVSRTLIESGAVIGGGTVIGQGIRIGRMAVVCDGAVVSRDVPPFAIVSGNPAAITGYSDMAGNRMASSISQDSAGQDLIPSTENCGKLVHLRKATDLRGSLVVAELGSDLPFVPQRFFVVYDVPSLDVRGEHAHHACEQFLVCLKGSVHAIVDDGLVREEFLLSSPNVGLYMPAMTWGTQYAYSSDAVLAVFASLPYDSTDYIRTYDAFLEAVKERSVPV